MKEIDYVVASVEDYITPFQSQILEDELLERAEVAKSALDYLLQIWGNRPLSDHPQLQLLRDLAQVADIKFEELYVRKILKN